MAVQNSTVEHPKLHAPALSPADAAAHQAASHVRSNRTEVRTRICQATILELSAMDTRVMTPADVDRLASAQAELDQLTAAKRGR
ncbi:MAG: hypothetical protein ACRDQ0_00065 [Pseudonocardia sp.]